jgi:uncharacterized repeat protein (TIGR01451 family)
MRRFLLAPALLLVLATFVAAFVNAQEARRGMTAGGDFTPPSPPQRFAVDAGAAPLAAVDGSEIRPTAGEGDGEPMLAPPPGKRTFRPGRLNTTVRPATPVETTPVEAEDASAASAPSSMPSVLKKKAGTPPSAAGREPEAPATIAVEEPAPTARRTLPVPSHAVPASPRETTIPSVRATATAGRSLQLNAALPHVSVSASGPKAVTVGKPASYEVTVTNDGGTAASGVEVRIGLPSWVQVRGAGSQAGEVRQERDASGLPWLVWTLDELAGSAKQHLALELAVTQNQPFEFTLQCRAQAAQSAAEIAVQEPQLEVRFEGASDMLFGEQKTFVLHVSNPGTGDAEGVAVEVSSGTGAPNHLQVGALPAGQKKQIPFTVAALSPGEMEIHAVASATGGLTAEATSRVLVHKPELQVAIEVPPMKFAGAESTYQVAVANVGDAVAEQVTLSVSLPTGAKYLGGLDGAAKTGDGMLLKIGNLAPNSEKVFDIRCMLMQAGENRFAVDARGKGDLTATSGAATQVEALADLKLSVVEPATPVAVGGEATYEVHIVNRGTKAAERVKVAVQFAQGLEPTEAVGGTASMSNGQALFEPLKEVAAGKEVVLTVKAKVEQAGSHAFRVEVKAGEPEAKLVSEGVTRCFTESAGGKVTARKSPGVLQPVPANKIR